MSTFEELKYFIQNIMQVNLLDYQWELLKQYVDGKIRYCIMPRDMERNEREELLQKMRLLFKEGKAELILNSEVEE